MSWAVTRTRSAGLADAPLEDVADAELAADGAHIHRLSLVGEHRVAGDHEEALELGQRGGDVLGDAVAEKLLLRIGAHVVERQHGDRRSVRKRERGPVPAMRSPPSGMTRYSPHRPLDVLERALAEVLEGAVELALEVVVGGAGDRTRRRLGQGSPGGRRC